MPSVVTVMISCVQRDAARGVTIPQLRRAGYPPHVALSPCDPPGPTQNNAVARAALDASLRGGSTHVLFVEDDIDLASDFGVAVRECVASPNDVTYLYLHDLPNRVPAIYGQQEWAGIARGEPQRPRIVPARQYAFLYGSQAVLMTREAAVMAREVLEEWKHDAGSADYCFVRAWAQNQARVGIRLPHAVQHRADKTLHERRAPRELRNAELQKSKSYHLPRSLVANNERTTGQ